jgi:hypothetical protein
MHKRAGVPHQPTASVAGPRQRSGHFQQPIDALIPGQWEEIFLSSRDSPTRRLWLAVLMDAIMSYMRGARHKPPSLNHQAVAEWFLQDDYALGGFRGICYALDLSADRILTGLARWVASGHGPLKLPNQHVTRSRELRVKSRTEKEPA